jgi:hypothetical protein
MAITRTTWTDGSTVINNARLQAIYDAVEGWALDTYTPSWTGSGSNPTLGNGTVSGKYIEIGDVVIGGFHFTMGSTTTYGSGSYSMSLPVTASTTWPGLCIVWAKDASAGGEIWSGLGYVFTTTTLLLVTNEDTDNAANWTPTVPIAFAQSDVLHGMFVYLRA